MASKLQCLLPNVVCKILAEVVNNAADALRFKRFNQYPFPSFQYIITKCSHVLQDCIGFTLNYTGFHDSRGDLRGMDPRCSSGRVFPFRHADLADLLSFVPELCLSS